MGEEEGRRAAPDFYSANTRKRRGSGANGAASILKTQKRSARSYGTKISGRQPLIQQWGQTKSKKKQKGRGGKEKGERGLFSGPGGSGATSVDVKGEA